MSEVFLYGTGGGGKGEDLEEVLTEQEELIESLKEALENKIAVSKTDIVPLTVTENGTYTAPEGQAYSPVEVNVAGSGGDDTLKGLIEGTLTVLNNSDATTVGQYAFYKDQKLESVNLPSVTSVGDYAFQQANITSLTLPNATQFGEYVFQSCKQLKSVHAPKIRTAGSYCFASCAALENVDLSQLNQIGTNMFYYCSSLKTISLPSAISPGSTAFASCTSLETVDLPALTTMYNQMFLSCSSLKNVNLPEATSLANATFQGCSNLEFLDFPKGRSCGNNIFNKCYSLKTIILRRTAGVCSLSNVNAFTDCYHFHGTVNETYNPNGDKDGYIYVPSALIDSYKVATNWSTFADQFRAIEDYPEICGEV